MATPPKGIPTEIEAAAVQALGQIVAGAVKPRDANDWQNLPPGQEDAYKNGLQHLIEHTAAVLRAQGLMEDRT